MMPALAGLMHLLIRRGARTFTESLVMCLYIYGHSLLLIAILLPTYIFSTPIGVLGSYLIPFALLSWTSSKFYAGRPALNALIALAAHTLFIAGMFIVFALAAVVILVAAAGNP
jgi:hypothetical protein